jgi:hypothetical protein
LGRRPSSTRLRHLTWSPRGEYIHVFDLGSCGEHRHRLAPLLDGVLPLHVLIDITP